jgi:NADH-quinone oxidoreductase subunit I
LSSLGSALLTSFQAMGTTLRNFFRRATTVQYPKVQRPIPKKWRGGSFALTFDPDTGEEICAGCRSCATICPSQIIAVTTVKGEPRKSGKGKTYSDVFTIDYQACMQCELCVHVCPTDALVMTRFMHEPSYDRAGLFLSKEKLMENGRRLLEDPEFQAYTTGSLLKQWSAINRGLPPAEPLEQEEPK